MYAMGPILVAVLCYLVHSVAIDALKGPGGFWGLVAVEFLAAFVMAVLYRKQIWEQRGLPIKWGVAFIGGSGIGIIMVALPWVYRVLPVSLGMEAVYNGLAIFSWPVFILLHLRWKKRFQERPNRFDLGCHLLMFILVIGRFGTYEGVFDLLGAAIPTALAIGAYLMLNISIKFAEQHRVTLILLYIIGGVWVGGIGLLNGVELPQWDTPSFYIAIIADTCAVLGILVILGVAYKRFGERAQSSLVIPLVYDGILVGTPLVITVTGESMSIWTFVLSAAMLLVSLVRYHHHNKVAKAI